MNTKIWIDISVGYPDVAPGYYSVSNVGEIRRDAEGNGAKPGETRMARKARGGYLRVNISYDRQRKTISIAQAVAFCFMGKPPEGMTIDHVNGVKTDNSLANLEYVTNDEQMRRAQVLGLLARGEKNGSAKLTEEAVREIRATKGKRKILADKFGVSVVTIDRTKRKEYWKHLDG